MPKPPSELQHVASIVRPQKRWSYFRNVIQKIAHWKRAMMHRIVEAKLIHKIHHEQYRKNVIRVYDGRRGALLVRAGRLSGHIRYGDRLFRERQFDLRGVDNILDIGSGAGQVLAHLIGYSSSTTRITGIDISRTMLDRARRRLKSNRPRLVVGDLANLPFPSRTFDCVTCCYVLEHLPDARRGLEEISRVLVPNGRVLLFVTEDNFGGAWTSCFWKCRTHNREDLLDLCESLGLELKKELWFTRVHRWFRAGGICVELVKSPLELDSVQDRDEVTNTDSAFVERSRTDGLVDSSLQVLQSEPVEGETSVSSSTRSTVSSS